jgi:YidC/Oxa1 family membrane protein insertase
MERRVLVTIALCAAILFGWMFIKDKLYPSPPPQAPVAAQNQPAQAPAPAQAPTAGTPAPAPTAGAPVAAAAPTKAPEQRVTIQRDALWRATFSTWGAAPVEITLLQPRYTESVDGKEMPIEMVKREAGASPFTVSFTKVGADTERSDFDLPADAAWTMVSQTPNEIVYATDVGSMHLEKRWTLPAEGYHFDVNLTVQNRGSAAESHHLVVNAPGWQDPNLKQGGLFSFGKRANLAYGQCEVNGKHKNLGLEEATTKPLSESGTVRWIGNGDHFFLSAIAFGGDAGAQSCNVWGDAAGHFGTRAVFAGRQLAPGEKAEYPMAVFVGPKLLRELDAVTIGKIDPGLGDSVDYSALFGINFEFLARPMLWALKGLQKVTVNWGVAILVISILLKIVTFYPNQKAMRSAKKMAALKPELDKLKERHGDDKQAFVLAQQKLFKERGVSMFGGCLPMLIQMPIFIAFYVMLNNAVELYHAGFVGPIRDLTQPFWPMALATGALMLLQQRLSPTSADPQQKMMMYMAPLMFMVFTLMLPSGLTLYYFSNTLLTMAQQWWINRTEPTPAPSGRPSGKPARGAKPARA